MGDKSFKWIRLTEKIEIFSVFSIISFLVCYALNYYVGSLQQELKWISIVMIVSSLLYFVFEIHTQHLTWYDRGHEKSHSFMSGVKNKPVAYKKYCNTLDLKKLPIWRKFVIGINYKGLLCFLLFVKLTIGAVLIAVLALKDNWDFRSIVLLVSCALMTIGLVGAYKSFPNILRSGAGLAYYLINTHESFQSVNNDFLKAEHISANLWISPLRIYFRDSQSVYVIKLAAIEEYKFGDHKILVRSRNELFPLTLSTKDEQEYSRMCMAILDRIF